MECYVPLKKNEADLYIPIQNNWQGVLSEENKIQHYAVYATIVLSMHKLFLG